MKWLFPNWKVARVIAVLYTLGCVSLLIRIILFRNASPREFWHATNMEQMWMLALSWPVCMICFLPLPGEILFGNLKNPQLTIFFIWLFFFLLGYFQWFVLVRAVVKGYNAAVKGYILAPILVRWIRHKLGIREPVRISVVPKK